MPRKNDETYHRRWVFTENNPNPDTPVSCKQSLLDRWDSSKITYFVVQLEAGEQGTPHFQGFIQFKDVQAFSKLKEWRPRAHFAIARGSAAENEEYCTKPDGQLIGPERIGTPPKPPGDKSKFHQAVESIQQGQGLRTIAQEYPAEFTRYHKGFKELKHQLHPLAARDFKTECWLFYGEAGTGKSASAFEFAKSLGSWYRLQPGNSGIWAEDYAGEDTCIIDEYKGNIQLGVFKELLDRYRFGLEVKGGSRINFCSKRIIVTSNLHWNDWYKNCSDEERKAVGRRFEFVVEFTDIPGAGVSRRVERDVRFLGKPDWPTMDYLIWADQQ